VRVYSVESGEEVRRFDRCFSPVFSPDGMFLAGSDGPLVRRWSLKSGAELPGLPAAKEPLRWVAYAPDSKKVAASVCGTWGLALWDLESRTLSYRERQSLGTTEATGLAFTPDSKDLTVGTLWGVDVGAGKSFEELLPGGPPLFYTPVGQLLIAGKQGKHLHIWNFRTMNWLFAEYLPFESEESLGVSEDADAVLRIGGTGIHLEAVPDPSRSLPLATPPPPISCVGYDPAGNELVADADGVVTLWSSGRKRELKRVLVPPPAVQGLSRDGKKALLFQPKGPAVVWNLETGKEYRKLDSMDRLSACSLSPQGTGLLLGTVDGTIVLWDLEMNHERWRLAGEFWVSALAWSSDGNTVAWGDADGGVGTAETSRGRETVLRRSRGTEISAMAVAPDGRAVVTGDRRGKILFWTDDLGREPSVLRTTGDAVAALAWSADGRWIAGSGSSWVWMVAADGARTEKFLKGSKGRMVSLAFSPDGSTLLGGGTDPSVYLWRVPAGK
jgi:WD40 repeat protein